MSKNLFNNLVLCIFGIVLFFESPFAYGQIDFQELMKKSEVIVLPKKKNKVTTHIKGLDSKEANIEANVTKKKKSSRMIASPDSTKTEADLSGSQMQALAASPELVLQNSMQQKPQKFSFARMVFTNRSFDSNSAWAPQNYELQLNLIEIAYQSMHQNQYAWWVSASTGFGGNQTRSESSSDKVQSQYDATEAGVKIFADTDFLISASYMSLGLAWSQEALSFSRVADGRIGFDTRGFLLRYDMQKEISNKASLNLALSYSPQSSRKELSQVNDLRSGVFSKSSRLWTQVSARYQLDTDLGLMMHLGQQLQSTSYNGSSSGGDALVSQNFNTKIENRDNSMGIGLDFIF